MGAVASYKRSTVRRAPEARRTLAGVSAPEARGTLAGVSAPEARGRVAGGERSEPPDGTAQRVAPRRGAAGTAHLRRAIVGDGVPSGGSLRSPPANLPRASGACVAASTPRL